MLTDVLRILVYDIFRNFFMKKGKKKKKKKKQWTFLTFFYIIFSVKIDQKFSIVVH